MTRQRLEPDERKEQILNAAVWCAETFGFSNLSQKLVSGAADCSPSLISHYWADWGGLLDDIMVEAVTRPLPVVVAQGLAAKHPIALDASEVLRRRAAASLVGK